jgi:4-hydroxy-tetrahydrodipicolinate synthase
MYHIPGRTAFTASLETLCEIAEATPHFVGMKHAAQDLALLSDALAAFGPEFRVFVGLEDLSFPMLCIGACGMMNAVGNLAPGKVAALYEAVAAGDLATGRRLHFELWELNKAIFFDTNPIPMKYMMRRLGIIPANEHRLPMMPADKVLEERLDGVLRRAGMLERAAAE